MGPSSGSFRCCIFNDSSCSDSHADGFVQQQPFRPFIHPWRVSLDLPVGRIGSRIFKNRPDCRSLFEVCPGIRAIAEHGANPSTLQVRTSDDLGLLRVVETFSCGRYVPTIALLRQHVRIDALSTSTVNPQREIALHDLQVQIVFVGQIYQPFFRLPYGIPGSSSIVSHEMRTSQQAVAVPYLGLQFQFRELTNRFLQELNTMLEQHKSFVSFLGNFPTHTLQAPETLVTKGGVSIPGRVESLA